MANNTIAIDRYLQNEMTEAERLSFESELAGNKALQQELYIQQQLSKAAATAGLKSEFSKAMKQQFITKQLLRWGLIAVIAAAAIYLYVERNQLFGHSTATTEQDKVNVNTVAPPEIFNISTIADTIIETKEGIVLAIPAHSFNTDRDKIELQVKTALYPLSIMQNGLSTMSNDSLLQTAGMFSVNGFDGDQLLQLNKPINVSVPASKIDDRMQLFDGKEAGAGRINWVNPKSIENRLRTYDIEKLDFYPPRYIPTLKALQKNYRNRQYTDSLYYSFSGYPHSASPASTTVPAIESNEYPVSDTSKGDGVQKQVYYREIYQVDPAKIKAIWNKQFNNTILATKEFEERLRYMHSICEDGYPEAYLQNLNKPLYKTDELIASNTQGSIKAKFLAFAKRKDGIVMIADALQKKLSTYFEQRSTAYRDAAEKTWAKYQDSLDALNRIADEKRRTAAINDFKRTNTNFEQEYCINLTNAYRQIGISRTCNDTFPLSPPAANYYNFNITTPGWKNLDAYVMDATADRKTMAYTDPATGKTATLTYQPISIIIDKREQYDRVLVYLLPDSLNSFQRVKEGGTSFKENLNALFRYDVVILAFKGDQLFFNKLQWAQPANYVFDLKPVTAADLKLALTKYELMKANDIMSDLDSQLFDEKELKRQLELQKEVEFREKIAASIFNCLEPMPGLVAVDSIRWSKK
jgi:hypothetical protein